MIDDCIIKGVMEIANTRMRDKYPLLDKHYCEEEIKIVCEAFYELSKLIVKRKGDKTL